MGSGWGYVPSLARVSKCIWKALSERLLPKVFLGELHLNFNSNKNINKLRVKAERVVSQTGAEFTRDLLESLDPWQCLSLPVTLCLFNCPAKVSLWHFSNEAESMNLGWPLKRGERENCSTRLQGDSSGNFCFLGCFLFWSFFFFLSLITSCLSLSSHLLIQVFAWDDLTVLKLATGFKERAKNPGGWREARKTQKRAKDGLCQESTALKAGKE